MKVAFRVDASQEIGSGHVMRCLTLADELAAQGGQCLFISRQHTGHLFNAIQERGHKLSCLPSTLKKTDAIVETAYTLSGPDIEPLTHATWLRCDWQTDAAQTVAILAAAPPDWLVVDHYALDHRWESALHRYTKRLMVIDDLADRAHKCDMLLDQNLGRQPRDYSSLVPANCQILVGPYYALLRPEFKALRQQSLDRRKARPSLSQIFISMGGVDQPNATGQVLRALKSCSLPVACRVTVVMGLTAPWLQNVQELAANMPWKTEVLVNIHDMAERMADSDLAIGAAGSTSWERCCLGLPTLIVVLAKNQMQSAQALHEAKAVGLLGTLSDIAKKLPIAIDEVLGTGSEMRMSNSASAIADGIGTQRVSMAMEI